MTGGHYRKPGGLLFIVSAPSGAGKTTLCRELAREMPALSHSVSHTTRSPRPGEREGEHYYFVPEEKFREMAGAGGFAEWAVVHGHLYGTSKAELERLFGQGRDVILDIDTQGAMQIRESGMGGVFVFVLPPSMDELERRLKGRESDDEEEIRRRLARAKDEIRSYARYDYIIVNDEFSEALGSLKAVVAAGKCRVDRVDEDWLVKNFGI